MMLRLFLTLLYKGWSNHKELIPDEDLKEKLSFSAIIFLFRDSVGNLKYFLLIWSSLAFRSRILVLVWEGVVF